MLQLSVLFLSRLGKFKQKNPLQQRRGFDIYIHCHSEFISESPKLGVFIDEILK